MNSHTLSVIAYFTRYECERVAREKHKKGRSYWCPDDLTGMCASASLILKYVLTHYEIPSVFIERCSDGGHHCWIKSCGYHVDITSTQFNGPKVYVEKVPFEDMPLPPDFRDHYYLEPVKVIMKKLIKLGWDRGDILEYHEIRQISQKIISKLI